MIANTNDRANHNQDAAFESRKKRTLGRVALFLGELRDGLTMINMQNAYLITTKGYTEKQAGVMFFVFGMSQFLFQTPAGYLMDHTEAKVQLLGFSAVVTTLLTLITAAFATENGGNLAFMVFIKFLQGSITALIPPGLNSITQGLVGIDGMTMQVSQNEMMNHLGTAIIILLGSLLAFWLYPNIGLLFIVSPLACIGVVYYLCQIKPGDIDHDAARGLQPSTMESANDSCSPHPTNQQSSSSNSNTPIDPQSSFDFVFLPSSSTVPKDDGNTTSRIFQHSKLLIFVFICFTFHLSNATILPLVMQALAVGNGRTGILLSGLCIIVAQVFMVMSASICGKYSGVHGRKPLFLIGILAVPLRCAILALLLHIKEGYNETPAFLNVLILSTQALDGVGAGVFGTMYVLVTSDISGGTGRFSFTLGLTTTAMSIGSTISGYLGQALAQDDGYREAFIILGHMALIPAILYFFCMSETLPEKTKQLTDGKAEEYDQSELGRKYKELI